MIDQIATFRKINSMRLIQHSQNITQTLRQKSQDSRTLSDHAKNVRDVSLQLMEMVDIQQHRGSKVLFGESKEQYRKLKRKTSHSKDLKIQLAYLHNASRQFI